MVAFFDYPSPKSVKEFAIKKQSSRFSPTTPYAQPGTPQSNMFSAMQELLTIKLNHYASGISINGSPKKVESIARVEIVTFFLSTEFATFA